MVSLAGVAPDINDTPDSVPMTFGGVAEPVNVKVTVLEPGNVELSLVVTFAATVNGAPAVTVAGEVILVVVPIALVAMVKVVEPVASSYPPTYSAVSVYDPAFVFAGIVSVPFAVTVDWPPEVTLTLTAVPIVTGGVDESVKVKVTVPAS
jgi:hypothetical protein